MTDDFDSESILLAKAICDPNVAAEAVADLTTAHFEKPLSRSVFEVIRSLHDQGVAADVTMLQAAGLKREDLAEVRRWVQDAFDARDSSFHIREIRNAYARREIAALADRIPGILANETDVTSVLTVIGDEIARVTEHSAGRAVPVNLGGILQEILDATLSGTHSAHVGGARRLMTGLWSLDDAANGLPANGLIIVGARPSQGKSAGLVALLREMARTREDGAPFVFFSMEMDRVNIALNLLSSESQIAVDVISPADGSLASLSDSDWGRLKACSKAVAGLNAIIFDDERLSPLDIRARCLRVKRDLKTETIAAIFVDYLQLLDLRPAQRKTSNRQQELGWATRELKILSREFGCPVIVAAQLNRDTDKQARAPRLSDLRESGDIEQDADMVILIHRPNAEYASVANADDIQPESAHDAGAEWIVAKNRNGPTGTAQMRFHGPCVRWESA